MKELFAFSWGCMLTFTTPPMARTHLPSSRPSSQWEWMGLANSGNAKDLLPWQPEVTWPLDWWWWVKLLREWKPWREKEEGRDRCVDDDFELGSVVAEEEEKEVVSNWKQLLSDVTSLGNVFTTQNSTWQGSVCEKKFKWERFHKQLAMEQPGPISFLNTLKSPLNI